jgi:hypothetical protein
MESFKKYFESSLIVPKHGAAYRLVFGRLSRNGHFQYFASGIQYAGDEVVDAMDCYTNFSLVAAVELYTRRVKQFGASIEGWLI